MSISIITDEFFRQWHYLWTKPFKIIQTVIDKILSLSLFAARLQTIRKSAMVCTFKVSEPKNGAFDCEGWNEELKVQTGTLTLTLIQTLMQAAKLCNNILIQIVMKRKLKYQRRKRNCQEIAIFTWRWACWLIFWQ